MCVVLGSPAPGAVLQLASHERDTGGALLDLLAMLLSVQPRTPPWRARKQLWAAVATRGARCQVRGQRLRPRARRAPAVPPGLPSAAALPCLAAGAGAEALRLPAGGSPGRGRDPSAPAVRTGEGGPGGPAPPRGRWQRQDGERRGLLRLRRKPRCCRCLRKALVQRQTARALLSAGVRPLPLCLPCAPQCVVRLEHSHCSGKARIEPLVGAALN